MPIEYACIAYGGVLLVEDKPVPHSFSPVVKKLIENAARHDTRASYQYEGSMYSTQVENEILYIVVTDTGLKTLTCFSFIGDVQHKFKAAMTGNPNTYPKPLELTPTRCASFSNTLQSLVKLYSDNPDHNNKMVKLKGDIEVVKAQMLDNIDAIIKRGGDIENIVDKTQMLEEDAVRFERRATKLSSMMFWRNVKIVIAIILTVLVLCFFISMIVCGATFKKCKSDPPPPAPPTPSPPETPEPPTPNTDRGGSQSGANQGSTSTTSGTPVPTDAPPTPEPPTPEPPTPEPPTPAPPTPEPPTPEPPTPEPPTPEPPTPEPPTPEPPTPEPPTPEPPTPAPGTPAPTPEPPTPEPITPSP